jgi:hypothetical protein
MVIGFEINPLNFLSTAAQEFQFPNGAVLSNDKTSHTSSIFSFRQNPLSSIIETNQNLSLQKKSISAADYTIAYIQTEISQEFSCCATPYYKIQHLMTHKFLSFVGNIYKDFSTVTIQCCVAKVEKS